MKKLFNQVLVESMTFETVVIKYDIILGDKKNLMENVVFLNEKLEEIIKNILVIIEMKENKEIARQKLNEL